MADVDRYICNVQIFARATTDSTGMIVGLSGEFDLAAVASVRSQIHSLLADGWTKLIIDLEGVGFIDSAGLGVLVGLHRRCRAAGGMMVVAAPSADVERLLAASELDSIFTVHAAVEDAGQALGSRPVDVL